MNFVLIKGEFACFRKQKKGRRRDYCKGPMKNKRRYSTPEKCCKKGKGFASRIVRKPKKKKKYSRLQLIIVAFKNCREIIYSF